MSHWKYNNKHIEELPEDVYGFVYEITSPTGKKYIGRKYVQSIRRKPLTKKQKLAGRKRKDVIKSESNWRDYCGSCQPLLEEIKNIGKEKFQFEIIAFGMTKGQTNFLEVAIQFKKNVLTDDNYYNDAIGSGQFKNIKIDEGLKKTLKNI